MKKINEISINATNLRVIALFTKGFDKEYYIREIQKLIKSSSRTAFLVLKDLESIGVLESKTRGKIKLYSLKNIDLIKDYLVVAELYKKMNFMSKYRLISEVMGKTERYVDGIGLIFGSYVKGLERKDSDLDIFVIGECDKNEIEKISEIYKIKINVKCYPLKLFKDKLGRDVLIKEILDNHVIFKNVEGFVDLLGEKK